VLSLDNDSQSLDETMLFQITQVREASKKFERKWWVVRGWRDAVSMFFVADTNAAWKSIEATPLTNANLSETASRGKRPTKFFGKEQY